MIIQIWAPDKLLKIFEYLLSCEVRHQHRVRGDILLEEVRAGEERLAEGGQHELVAGHGAVPAVDGHMGGGDLPQLLVH